MIRLIKIVVVAALALAAWGASAVEPQLYMAGDSIMTEYKSDMFPQYGWGQALKSFMKSPENLHNFARSVRSEGSEHIDTLTFVKVDRIRPAPSATGE